MVGTRESALFNETAAAAPVQGPDRFRVLWASLKVDGWTKKSLREESARSGMPVRDANGEEVVDYFFGEQAPFEYAMRGDVSVGVVSCGFVLIYDVCM